MCRWENHLGVNGNTGKQDVSVVEDSADCCSVGWVIWLLYTAVCWIELAGLFVHVYRAGCFTDAPQCLIRLINLSDSAKACSQSRVILWEKLNSHTQPDTAVQDCGEMYCDASL